MTARKPPERRQNRETADVTDEVTGGPGAEDGPPPAPRHLSEEIERAWGVFWAMKPLSRKVGDADMRPLMRLFQLYEIYELSINAFMAEPWVTGERGKLVAHPGWSTANAAMRQILPLERGFGITPKARAELGITLGVSANPAAGEAAMDFTDDDDG